MTRVRWNSASGFDSGILNPVEGADRFWGEVIDALPDHISILDRDGRIVAVNTAWRRFGESNGGVEVGVGSDYLAVCDIAATGGEPSAASAAILIRDVLDGKLERGSVLYPCHSPDDERWFMLVASPLGGGAGAVVQHHNVTERRRAEREIAVQARLLNEVPSAVVALDRKGKIIYWNDAATSLYGWSRAEVVGDEFPSRAVVGDDWAVASEELRLDGRSDRIVRVRRRSGEIITISARLRLLRNSDGRFDGVVGVAVDASEQLAREAELRGGRDLQRALAESIADGIVAVDHDGIAIFLNPAAEQLLGWSLDELERHPLHDLVCLGSNTHKLGDDLCPITIARREDRVVEVNADTFSRRDGSSLSVAYKASPFAAPDRKRGTVVVFRDNTRESGERERRERDLLEITWAARVRDALSDDRFTLFAQPIVEIATNRTVRHELLLRMELDGGMVAPNQFLPAARRHKLMPEIDVWVTTRALQYAAAGHPVSFNLSAESLTEPSYVSLVKHLLDESGADPGLVVIEVTETSVVEDEEAATRALKLLRDVGFKIAMDDFGTGYGGFTYLKRLPIDLIKIDREFVGGVTEQDTAVVEAVVHLARAFNKRAIAEGVETQEQLDYLAGLGVEYAQGYLFGRPADSILIFGRELGNG